MKIKMFTRYKSTIIFFIITTDLHIQHISASVKTQDRTFKIKKGKFFLTNMLINLKTRPIDIIIIL